MKTNTSVTSLHAGKELSTHQTLQEFLEDGWTTSEKLAIGNGLHTFNLPSLLKSPKLLQRKEKEHSAQGHREQMKTSLHKR